MHIWNYMNLKQPKVSVENIIVKVVVLVLETAKLPVRDIKVKTLEAVVASLSASKVVNYHSLEDYQNVVLRM